jgi:hypothetical protein
MDKISHQWGIKSPNDGRWTNSLNGEENPFECGHYRDSIRLANRPTAEREREAAQLTDYTTAPPISIAALCSGRCVPSAKGQRARREWVERMLVISMLYFVPCRKRRWKVLKLLVISSERRRRQTWKKEGLIWHQICCCQQQQFGLTGGLSANY